MTYHYYDRRRPRPKPNPVAFAVGGVFAVIILFGVPVVLYWLLFSPPKSAPHTSADAPARVYKSTPDEIYAEWAVNQTAARLKYKADPVEFTGTLTEFFSGRIKVRGESHDPECYIIVTARDGSRAELGLAKCKAGQKITVRGRSDSYFVGATPWIAADEIRPAE